MYTDSSSSRDPINRATTYGTFIMTCVSQISPTTLTSRGVRWSRQPLSERKVNASPRAAALNQVTHGASSPAAAGKKRWKKGKLHPTYAEAEKRSKHIGELKGRGGEENGARPQFQAQQGSSRWRNV